jgi:hypothetical protein
MPPSRLHHRHASLTDALDSNVFCCCALAWPYLAGYQLGDAHFRLPRLCRLLHETAKAAPPPILANNLAALAHLLRFVRLKVVLTTPIRWAMTAFASCCAHLVIHVVGYLRSIDNNKRETCLDRDNNVTIETASRQHDMRKPSQSNWIA